MYQNTNTSPLVSFDGGLSGTANGEVMIISASGVFSNLAPSSSVYPGTAGRAAFDSSYIYICTATNTWKRVAIAAW